MELVPMVVREVGTDPWGHPMVILADRESRRFLPIWIGPWEAYSIAAKLQGARQPRPLTHDLLTDVLGRLGVRIERVVVSEFRDSTYFAVMTLRENGGVREIDARPSDAIALALRTGAALFASEQVLQQAALEQPGPEDAPDRMKTFRRLINDLDEEDTEDRSGAIA